MADMSVLGTAPVAAWCPSLDTAGNGTTTLTDLSGNGYNGTLTNMDAATDWPADTGAGGVRALDFDGSNDYVTCGDISTIKGIAGLSISLWVKTDRVNAFKYAIGKATTANNRLGVYLNSGAVGFTLETGSTVYGQTDLQVNNNDWSHAIFVFDGAETGNALRCKIYIDSVLATISFTGSVGSLTPSTTDPFLIGARTISSNNISARIDDVRIFNIVLTADQRSYLYASGLGRGVQPTGNPTGILQNNLQSMRLGL